MVNHEEQHSIWPAKPAYPLGMAIGGSGRNQGGVPSPYRPGMDRHNAVERTAGDAGSREMTGSGSAPVVPPWRDKEAFSRCPAPVIRWPAWLRDAYETYADRAAVRGHGETSATGSSAGGSWQSHRISTGEGRGEAITSRLPRPVVSSWWRRSWRSSR